jgi:hypothetical protein
MKISVEALFFLKYLLISDYSKITFFSVRLFFTIAEHSDAGKEKVILG